MDGCSALVTHRWRDAQCEVDCAVYYAPVSGGSVTLRNAAAWGKQKKKKKKSQEGSNLKINARAVIAHYISETVNMTEILITPNAFFFFYILFTHSKTTRLINLRVIVGKL